MKRILFIVCCLCASMLAFAQQQTVTGTVYDESGLPLIGVSVQEKGTSNGAITDIPKRYPWTVGPISRSQCLRIPNSWKKWS